VDNAFGVFWYFHNISSQSYINIISQNRRTVNGRKSLIINDLRFLATVFQKIDNPLTINDLDTFQ